MKNLLKTLTESSGPSGYEDEVRDTIVREVKPFADEVRVDALGSVIAHRRPVKNMRNPIKILLAAPMDETGVIVSHVDRKGFVRFSSIGGVPARYVLGAHIRFLNGAKGVVGYDRQDQTEGSIPINKMVIDVGAGSLEECPVRVGDIGVFGKSFLEMGNRLAARSIACRAGAAVLIDTMRHLKSTAHDVFFAFTTHNQVGRRAVGPVTFGIDPDVGISVDGTPAGDTPASSKLAVELGKGPCVKIRDEDMLADARVVDWMIKTAARTRIPCQREVSMIDSSGAMKIQLSRAGVMAGAVSIPVRYLQSSSEMLDLTDLKNTMKLITALLTRPAPFA